MNEDIYAEWLVKRKNSGLVPLFYVGAGVLILVFLFLGTMSTWAWLGFVAVGLGIYFGRRFLYVEYEYIFVTNELAIDRIYDGQSRKKAMRVEMMNIESVELTEEGRNKNALEKGNVKFLDYSSGKKDAVTYTVTFTEKGIHYLMLIEPNDKLLRAMWRCSPSKVHIAK